MKYTFLAASVSVLLSGCANTGVTSEQNAAINTPASAPLAPVQGAPVAKPDNSKVITLEKAMSDPDWIARSPQNWYWGDDSNTVFYQQKRLGNPVKDLVQKSLNSDGNGDKVDYANLHLVADANAVENADGSKELYVFKGNVFLKDLKRQSVKQLTFTSAVESQPRFLADGRIEIGRASCRERVCMFV